MNYFNQKKLTYYLLILIFPAIISCSFIFRGKVYNDPRVAAQQELVDIRQGELKEAKQREKAARQRLKAAKIELKALKSQVKRRGY